MSPLLRHILLLVFLIGGNVVLVKASDYAVECGKDICCITMAKLMAATNDKLDKHAIETKEKFDKQTTELNSKLDKLDKQATEMNAKLDEQAKDLEELKVRSNSTAVSTKDISTQLERHSADLLNHDGRLKAHDVSQRNEYPLVQSIHGAEMGPRDCSDIQSKGYTVSGIYRVYPGSDNKRIEADVYCDFKTPGQSWLVFQRRKDGSVNFERYWKDYEQGFGNLNGEFWLGNEKLSLLTMNRKYKLRVVLEDFAGQIRYAEYSTFSVRPATDKYRLTVGGYSGNAGDSLAWHNGMQFTTKDADNDPSGGNCAQIFHGAWWYNTCHNSNLNGLYLRGSHASYGVSVEWSKWLGHYYSLKTTEMKIAAVF